MEGESDAASLPTGARTRTGTNRMKGAKAQDGQREYSDDFRISGIIRYPKPGVCRPARNAINRKRRVKKRNIPESFPVLVEFH
jgi:hypothetical protein